MTNLRKELIAIFNRLSEIESMKAREYPSRAFKSVATSLLTTDHYSIHGDRVVISNKQSNYSKVLGTSSSAVFIEYVTKHTCSRIANDPITKSDLDNISGIGPTKKVALIKAGITNSEELTKLNLKINDIIPGTNIRFTNQINTGLILWNKTHGLRITRELADEYISDFKKNVREDIYVLGSYRRNKPTIGDIDIVMVNDGTDYSNSIIKWLDEVLVHGNTKIAGIKGKTQVDIRMIDKKFLGAHILHGTGSQEFNIKLRYHAKTLGMRLNEYGIIDKNGVFHTFENELEVFKFLGLDYVAPELR